LLGSDELRARFLTSDDEIGFFADRSDDFPTRPHDEFRRGLGIRMVGAQNAAILAGDFGTLEALMAADTAELLRSIARLGSWAKNSTTLWAI
jgi:NAD-dependent DNA ligase